MDTSGLQMFCSSCSIPLRPLVALDIDGTLGAYHEHLATFMGFYWGAPKLSPEWLAWKHSFVESWDGRGDFEDWLGLDKQEYRQAKLAYRQGGWKRWMPAYPRAAKVVRSIRERAELWIATSRPWQRLDNIDPDTIEWLHRNDIEVDGIVYGDNKYEQLVSAIDPNRITLVVDDLGEQCERADALSLPVIQRQTLWNRGNRWKMGVSGLDELGEWAHGAIDIWKDRYERR